MSEPDPLELVHKYLDGLADNAESAALERWLREDPAHLRAFARAAYLDQRTREQLEEDDLRDLIGSVQSDDEAPPAATRTPMPTVAGASPEEPNRRRAVGLALSILTVAVAACLVGFYLAGVLGPATDTNADALVDSDGRPTQAADDKAEQAAYRRWLAYSQRLRQDPDLIAYYTFEPDHAKPDTLVNQADATAGRFDGRLGSPDDADTAPRWAAGRFPGHPSLDFAGADKQHVAIPHEQGLNLADPCTVSLWVYNDTPVWTAHLLTKRFYKPDGSYITNIGIAWIGVDPIHHRGERTYYHTFEFGDVTSFRAWVGPHESPEGLPQSPRWVNLTITYDGESIVYYLDGERTDTKPAHPENSMADIDDDLVLGDSTTAGSQLKNSFDGRIDELVLLGRVWTDAEARAFYEAGRPVGD
ncbi:DUF4880 domain-containing protein [Phycisphaeraceae bacterium D3-23]